MNNASRKGEAIVLLSGGLDSATAAAWALAEGYSVTAISFDYGQRHRIELRAAKAVADDLGITDHVSIAIDLAAFGASALVDKSIDVPKNRSESVISSGIPVTYVPARNTVFLALALALAEARNASSIVLGVNSIDYSGYPDCRPEFLNAFETLANLATKSGVEGTQFSVLAPLVSLTKPEIIELGLSLGVDYGLTTSCYDPKENGQPCGECDSCVIRKAGFSAVNMLDPRVASFTQSRETNRGSNC